MGFGGLYVSVSGLTANKHSLNTVGHNIANVNNPEYVRQSALHSEAYYRDIGRGIKQGSGVYVSQIRQIRDEFLDIQLRRELPRMGYYGAKADILADVEAVFNEISDSGLQNIMDNFWDSWSTLYEDPESLAARGLVHESTVAFTDTVNHISKQLTDIQINLNKELEIKVARSNDLIDSIASLNKQIILKEAAGANIRANDLRDRRNSLVDQIHQLLPVKTYEDFQGGTVISLDGRSLVDGAYINKLDLREDKTENTGFKHLYWANSDQKIRLGGQGQIGGIIDIRDGSLGAYKNHVDTMVGQLAEKINSYHRQGQGLDGSTGLDFFLGGEEINAYNIRINPDLSDLNKISVSATGDKGDGEIAQLIIQLRDLVDEDFLRDPISGEPLAIDDYYRRLISLVSLERQESINIATNQGFLVKAIDEKRQALSAVSLDEEMAEMLKLQHSYTANTRVFNAIDEMIETVVNRVGLVGR